MFVELHILQNFAPSNLNRDDTNAPKDCEFGGFRRARISSQCLKRSIRSEFSRSELIAEEHRAKRTRRLIDELTTQLVTVDRAEAQVRAVVEFAVNGAGLATKEGRTEYLLFLSTESIRRFAALIGQHWDELVPLAGDGTETLAEGKAKKEKKKAKAEAPESLRSALRTLLDGTQAADLALFGRMLADLPADNVNAASQVAHAISTNKVEMEFDFFTAVDDLQQDGATGAGMMGTVEFNSSCFYRYLNVDVAQLTTNLGGDSELALRTVEAFVRAAVLAVPTGKQNSMAAQNPPSFVLAVVRDSGLWSLANAFVKPVWPKKDDDLVSASIRQLDGYWQQLADNYGTGRVRAKAVMTMHEESLTNLKADRKVASGEQSALDVVIASVRAALNNGGQS